MQVIANRRGFDGLKTREEGEEFAMPEGSKATWFDSVEKPQAAPATVPGAKAKGKAKTASEASAEFEDEIA